MLTDRLAAKARVVSKLWGRGWGGGTLQPPQLWTSFGKSFTAKLQNNVCANLLFRKFIPKSWILTVNLYRNKWNTISILFQYISWKQSSTLMSGSPFSLICYWISIDSNRFWQWFPWGFIFKNWFINWKKRVRLFGSILRAAYVSWLCLIWFP